MVVLLPAEQQRSPGPAGQVLLDRHRRVARPVAEGAASGEGPLPQPERDLANAGVAHRVGRREGERVVGRDVGAGRLQELGDAGIGDEGEAPGQAGQAVQACPHVRQLDDRAPVLGTLAEFTDRRVDDRRLEWVERHPVGVRECRQAIEGVRAAQLGGHRLEGERAAVVDLDDVRRHAQAVGPVDAEGPVIAVVQVERAAGADHLVALDLPGGAREAVVHRLGRAVEGVAGQAVAHEQDRLAAGNEGERLNQRAHRADGQQGVLAQGLAEAPEVRLHTGEGGLAETVAAALRCHQTQRLPHGQGSGALVDAQGRRRDVPVHRGLDRRPHRRAVAGGRQQRFETLTEGCGGDPGRVGCDLLVEGFRDLGQGRVAVLPLQVALVDEKENRQTPGDGGAEVFSRRHAQYLDGFVLNLEIEVVLGEAGHRPLGGVGDDGVETDQPDVDRLAEHDVLSNRMLPRRTVLRAGRFRAREVGRGRERHRGGSDQQPRRPAVACGTGQRTPMLAPAPSGFRGESCFRVAAEPARRAAILNVRDQSRPSSEEADCDEAESHGTDGVDAACGIVAGGIAARGGACCRAGHRLQGAAHTRRQAGSQRDLAGAGRCALGHRTPRRTPRPGGRDGRAGRNTGRSRHRRGRSIRR